jgi:hypothetical protein
MTRVVSVGRSSKGLVSAGALGLVLAAVTLTGCPGSLENPDAFPPPVSGAAGSPSGAAGTGAAGMGAAGTGAAGTGAGGAVTCDVTPFLGDGNTNAGKYFCSTNGVCHDTKGSAANLDLGSAGLAARLVGVVPKGGGAVTPSVCAADAAEKNMPYITKGSPTGAGLLLSKLMGAVCNPGGMQMPTLGPKVTATDLTCFQQWATALANQ